ncbi:tagatose-bisphosphate aldolase [bacterium]|nr:tagatose-bisphosphate aldolase [bacterium]|tara:strand:+ start:21540 stop:22409 length:870 start_codon:yes stop_codon:yes gene_type:complete
MKTLRECTTEAREEGRAIGHFNISDSNQLNAIAAAARDVGSSVVIGLSEGEREFLGGRKAVAMIAAAREEFGIDIFLNADHAHEVHSCKSAIDVGFDSVIFDGTKLSLEDNIAKTKEVVAYAKMSGRDVIVESELGYIGTSSKLLDDVPEDVVLDSLPTAEDAENFVARTGIDALAPAVGNLHGMLKGRSNPSLQINLISAIRAVLPTTELVLHGGSGLTRDDFQAAIRAGMNVVHINTEIRVAYRKGIENALRERPDEVAPYRYLNQGRDAVQRIVTERLELFTGKYQ